ncbi:MAG: DNA methyltransferase [Rikenellaceae bacterium]
MEQKKLFELEHDISNWRVLSFSADKFAEEQARINLENKYIKITEITDDYNRQSVSYQLSKHDCLHRWLKYKEGFSADLVSKLLDEFNIKDGDVVLDPFLGSGTTSLVCNMRGIDSIGYDILPISAISISAKQNIFRYSLSELEHLYDAVKNLNIPSSFKQRTKYINITQGAYSEHTEKEIEYITQWNSSSKYSREVKNLVTLCIVNSLERVSYTAKDGQYLRWDYRSPKMIVSAAKREKMGRKPLVVRLDKGKLPSMKEALLSELQSVIMDINTVQNSVKKPLSSSINFIQGSALFELPKLQSNMISGVITSPPYCNRYDYTRTYALELSYLKISDNSIKELRQDLLSCTVENRSKLDRLREYYISLDRFDDFSKVINAVDNNRALQEIKRSLEMRSSNGDINNKGVLRMVNSYFTELAFMYFELFRVCKPGAKVAFVNDNVRYGGEVIPVDFISTDIAEQLGFKALKVYTLKQQKGNSSQQMKKYGRVPLRKSITIWEKPVHQKTN